MVSSDPPALDPQDRLAGLSGDLTAEQHAAVLHEGGSLCLLAAAGAGKTRVLTRRVARRVLDGSATPDRSLVVTFTRKAASELHTRLARLGVEGVWAGTFHAAAYDQLRRHRADAGLAPLTVVADPTPIVASLLDGRLRSVDLRRVVAELAWAQARCLGPADYGAAADAARRRAPLPADQIAELVGRFRDAKRRRGVADLGDLVEESASRLEDDPRAAATFRWRFRHLYVDELQDVNPAQWRLLRAWLGDGDDLFVVGDPHQAVYGWNGADPDLVGRLPELLPGITVLRLTTNHRSSARIVAAASSLLGPAPGDRPRASDAQPEGSEPTFGGFPDDVAEAAALTRWLRRSRPPGKRWSELAVLGRTHAILVRSAELLEAAGIPCRLPEAPASSTPLNHRDAGRSEDPASPEQLLGALDPGLALRSALAHLLAEPVGAHIGGDGGVLELAEELLSADPAADVATFLGWMRAGDRWSSGAGPGRADTVALLTFHRAKGLEWPAVAIVGLEDGLVPVGHTRDQRTRAEERRLLYVAMTRARSELWCSWAQRRLLGGRPVERDRSPFLDEISREAGPDPRTAPRPTTLEDVAALRAALATTTS